MNIRFYIDVDTQRPHIEAHGLSAGEAVQALLNADEDFAGRDGARIAIGRTSAGKRLRIIYTLDSDGSVFVITGYRLEGKALKAFNRRSKDRRK